MRQLLVLLLSFGLPAVFGQTPSDSTPSIADKQVELASQMLQRIQGLVEIGAEPRIRLEQAREDLADAQDDVILERDLQRDFSAHDTTSQADEVVAAAQRRVDRQQARVEEAQKLVATGLVALSYLTPFVSELTARQIQLDLANSRAQSVRDTIARNKEPQPDSVPGGAAQNEPPIEYAEMFTSGMEHYEGAGEFHESRDLKPLEKAFEKKFDRPLPISAEGETELHRALGFDHRGRIDVAINPDSSEGVWLRRYLRALKIPYYAFTRAIAGKATAAHIHIGPGSTRLQNAD
jgi:hypothetical protein